MNSTYEGIKFSDADVVNPDDFIPAGEFNPHNVVPWLLHDHGFVLAVVFASNLQDAIDEAVDADKLDRYLLDRNDRSTQDDYMAVTEDGSGFPVYREENLLLMLDWKEGISFLGNAGEPFDIEGLSAIELPNPKFSFCALFNTREGEQ